MKRLVAAVALVSLGSTASADKVAVLGVETIDLPEPQGQSLAEALRTMVRETSGVKLIPGKDFVEMKFLFNCMDPQAQATCLVAAGRSLALDRFIVGAIAARRRSTHVSLKLVDVNSGQVVRSVEDEVASGDLLITSNVARWVNVLLSATPPAAKLVVTSEPDDATITVDGKEVGRTPTTVAVAPGTTHILRVGKDGWDTSTRTVSGRAGETLKIDVSLRPVAPPSVATTPERPSETPAPPARQRPGRTALLIGGVALGAAALAGGISIYTWRRFSDRKGEAEALLDPMYRSSPDDVKVSANEWFRHPDCNVPKGVPASESRARYETLCAEGTTAASATTGLLIGTGVLAAVAATSFGVGINLARNDEKDRGAKRALAPRLRLIEPVVTQQGGGLSASFEF